MLRALVMAVSIVVLAAAAAAQDLQSVLRTHSEEIAKPSRRSVQVAIDDLIALGQPEVPMFLERWQGKEVYQWDTDGQFYYVDGADPFDLIDISTGEVVGQAPKGELSQIKPNAGVRGVIGTALVQFQLQDPDPERRIAALDAIARDGSADQLEPLAASIDAEPDAAIRARKESLLQMLTARFGDATEDRVAAIEALSTEVSVDARAVMNQILTSQNGVATELPDANIAEIREPEFADAYAELVAADLAEPALSADEIKSVLAANIVEGRVGGIPVSTLSDPDARIAAYQALADAGTVAPLMTQSDMQAAIDAHVFYSVYDEPIAAVTDAAVAALKHMELKVGAMQTADLAMDAISLASIYFLAAIGLAVTFGVMGVINMAHGEFIMMGAYTGYVIQQIIPDYTVSIIVALPVAFAVTFAAGVAMERLVIRHLYKRPLETLLATFGISIALQQIAKNIFGTQARPLTSPAWLDGALVFNDVVAISYIRIAIFVLAVLFLCLILFILKKTRLGLEVRAVTQNPGMAASMGINPDRINMLTFGLGSGIAGIAGVAIGLYAKVTSEMGADYIVQSFMTVVVGGVGNVWGTLAGASLIGFLQKGIEWMNPSNTLAAQTYMILFIIIFIQFRPKGIVALKGRAAGN
ncbi:urea ABC transporter permease subunit UrtB [Marivivens niveibacter]|uniref:Urea ABC transporter permease subunit UrtB n=1 Tax=Marivivens niveibacter TaxID=1930667 RepID=A0A251X249_9RHOB|nr:urea ABC transporter permease subunit UrtB [Marivivens niveibacter]OUD10789.1 urea ABC transporter permease subunit UrtB [Marivivens niveibacter]